MSQFPQLFHQMCELTVTGRGLCRRGLFLRAERKAEER